MKGQDAHDVHLRLIMKNKAPETGAQVLLFRMRDGRSMNARNQSRLFFSATDLVALQDSRGGKRKKDEGPGCARCSSEIDNEKTKLPKQERRFSSSECAMAGQ